MYWLLRIFKNKTIWVILQRLALTRNGTKFSSIFFFIPLHNFGARTWDFLPYVLWYLSICTHSMSTKPSWYEVRLETEDSLGEFSDDDLMELPGSPTENPSVIYVNGAGCVSTRDLDLSYSWLISLCSVDTHKNPEFCFLGKYWNSGLKSPILRTWSNFVPGLQCASTAESPPCSQVHGWNISVHITFHNQCTLSGSLIFILLSLY